MFVLVGTKRAIFFAIKNDKALVRNTLLAQRLNGQIAEGKESLEEEPEDE
jgi:hypothetical protein